MAVTDPTIVKFSNEKIRVFADRILQAYWFAKTAQDEWFNSETGLGGTISADTPNLGTEQIMDGADTDGRSLVFGDDMHAVMTRMSDLITDLETASKLETLSKVAVHPTR